MNTSAGPVSAVLFQLDNLQVLILTLNRLTGTGTIGRCRGLFDVRIGDNRLSGAIPPSIGDATSLSGGIPMQFTRGANLTLLNLVYNRLAGEMSNVDGELVSGNGLDARFWADGAILGSSNRFCSFFLRCRHRMPKQR
jgi:hypothetical protein